MNGAKRRVRSHREDFARIASSPWRFALVMWVCRWAWHIAVLVVACRSLVWSCLALWGCSACSEPSASSVYSRQGCALPLFSRFVYAVLILLGNVASFVLPIFTPASVREAFAF
eukprot:6209630-Pleurochrysis_carterae.AAC.4